MLDHWDEVSSRIGGRSLAVFLDYDGTLAAIAPRPELATLDEAQRGRLQRLARRRPVAIVTGRALADARALVGLPEVYYATNHGFQIHGPDVDFEVAPELRGTFEAVADDLRARVGHVPGVVLESKGYAVALHYRLVAPDRVAELETAVDAVIAAHEGVRKTTGKRVFEVRPVRQWHKGSAVQWLMRRFGVDTAVYVGDDRTDEDALAVVRELGGIAIMVGEPPWQTAAEYGLADPHDVGRLLDALYDRSAA